MNDHRPDDTGTGGPRRDDADGRKPPAPHPSPPEPPPVRGPGQQWVGRPARPADHEAWPPPTGPETVSGHFGASSVPPQSQPGSRPADGPWPERGVPFPDGFRAATGPQVYGSRPSTDPRIGPQPSWADAGPADAPPGGVYYTEGSWAGSGPPAGTAVPHAGLEIARQAQYPVDPATAARPQPASDAATPQALPAPPPLAPPERSTSSEVVIGRTAVTPSRADGTVDGMARRVAVPAVTATPLAATAAVAARDLVERRPDEDTPPEGDAEADADARTGPTGRMPSLHIGRHLVRRSTLARMSVPAPDAGLVLGRDRRDAAVPMRLFAPAPVRVALVGGVWAAQLLIFRAFALGARVTVVTSEPASWIGFGERATGQYDRLTVLADDRAAPAAGTAQQPILSVYDLWEAGPATTTALGPWRSQLTILRQLDRPGVPALQDAQYTLLQRLGGEEATLATSALRLRRHTGQFLQFMADDMLALVTDGADRYFSVAQTPVEHDHVGPPRR